MKRTVVRVHPDVGQNISVVRYKHTRGDKYVMEPVWEYDEYDNPAEIVRYRRRYLEPFPKDHGTVIKIDPAKPAYYYTKPFDLGSPSRWAKLRDIVLKPFAPKEEK